MWLSYFKSQSLDGKFVKFHAHVAYLSHLRDAILAYIKPRALDKNATLKSCFYMLLDMILLFHLKFVAK